MEIGRSNFLTEDSSTRGKGQQGGDISTQTSRQVTSDDYENQDYILAMDYDNLANLQQQCPVAYQSKLMLMLSFHPDDSLQEVPDPYYGGAQGFEIVYEMVELACRNLFKQVTSNL